MWTFYELNKAANDIIISQKIIENGGLAISPGARFNFQRAKYVKSGFATHELHELKKVAIECIGLGC